jgi:hypothetical protein
LNEPENSACKRSDLFVWQRLSKLDRGIGHGAGKRRSGRADLQILECIAQHDGEPARFGEVSLRQLRHDHLDVSAFASPDKCPNRPEPTLKRKDE